MYKTPRTQPLLLWSYSLILGGAIGNVADRINHGFVVDFLHFYYQNWHFPAFNVADIAISIGAGLLILEAVLDHFKTKSNPQSTQTDETQS
jgi:signal peptidase II